MIIFNILTPGNALKCILRQAKGRDRKSSLLAALAGGPHFAVLPPDLPKLSEAPRTCQPKPLEILTSISTLYKLFRGCL